jgi:hypothetical protein
MVSQVIMETPKRPRDLTCPGAPVRPLAKRVAGETNVVTPFVLQPPPPLFNAAGMYAEYNDRGEFVVRHPPPLKRNRFGDLIEPYPGK